MNNVRDEAVRAITYRHRMQRRMKYMVWLMILVVGLSAYTTTHDPIPPFEKMINATVTLKVQGVMNSFGMQIETNWTGSGVMIAEQTIITANHVVEGAQSIVAIDNEGNEYEVLDFYGTTYTDLGVVIIAPNPLPTVSLASAPPFVGETVYICGSSLGKWTNSLTEGIVAHLDRSVPTISPKSMYQTCSPAYPGNSGGPVYNVDGEVIGILVAGYDATLNFCVPYDQVRAIYELYVADRILRGM